MNDPCASPFCEKAAVSSITLPTIQYHLCNEHAEDMYRRLKGKREFVLWSRLEAVE